MLSVLEKCLRGGGVKASTAHTPKVAVVRRSRRLAFMEVSFSSIKVKV